MKKLLLIPISLLLVGCESMVKDYVHTFSDTQLCYQSGSYLSSGNIIMLDMVRSEFEHRLKNGNFTLDMEYCKTLIYNGKVNTDTNKILSSQERAAAASATSIDINNSNTIKVY